MSTSIFDEAMPRQVANHCALGPVAFVERAGEVFAGVESVVHGQRRYTWHDTRERARRLAAALTGLGIERGDTVSLLLSNTPEMLEAHYAVPALGAVINALNTRLDAAALGWQMQHCEAQVLIVDSAFGVTARQAVAKLAHPPTIVDVIDSEFTGSGEPVGAHEYEALLAASDPIERLPNPFDEWDAIAVSYTSGTTGEPKGVVTHHRGAYLNAVCNAVTWTLPQGARYLWTLPMFHCNGWCFPWTVAMLGGTHVCLREVNAATILAAFREHRADHYCAAPLVHEMILKADPALHAGIDHPIRGMVAAAAPPATMISGMQALGIDITHVYGLTEVYGPAAVALKPADWTERSLEEKTRLNGRQGVRYALQDGMTVVDPDTREPVPADGITQGEIVFRGNIVMKGYLKRPDATAEAFQGGWFRTGDLAVLEPDGHVRIRDRAKDIIITGGENVSSLEIEDALYAHPGVGACAVVALPHPHWGETPLAFVERVPGGEVTPDQLIAHCRERLAGFKVPHHFRFEPIERTATGKIRKNVLRERARAIEPVPQKDR